MCFIVNRNIFFKYIYIILIRDSTSNMAISPSRLYIFIYVCEKETDAEPQNAPLLTRSLFTM